MAQTIDTRLNTITAQVNGSNTSVTPLLVVAAVPKVDIMVTDITISASAAMNVILQDQLGNVILNRIYLPINGTYVSNLATPIPLLSGTSLYVKASVTNAVTVNVVGSIINLK